MFIHSIPRELVSCMLFLEFTLVQLVSCMLFLEFTLVQQNIAPNVLAEKGNLSGLSQGESLMYSGSLHLHFDDRYRLQLVLLMTGTDFN